MSYYPGQILGSKSHHGICVPLFSLRSQKSCGIGEYLDLLPLIPWCSSIGFNILQLLPLNDTAGGASPYSAVSAFALNPIHLSLRSLPNAPHSPLLKELEQLNQTRWVAYEKVWPLKNAYLQLYFKINYQTIKETKEYKQFIEKSDWLDGYAQFFCRNTPFFPVPLYDYLSLLQFLCHKQLEKVKKCAETYGILLKGDIPILLARDSVDVSNFPELFDLSLEAGAPPDEYAEEGQNWGLPLYAWEEQQEAILQWWKRRLLAASHYFHLYRLDHVVGLFRIWGIPKGMPAVKGYFVPRSSETRWKEEGRLRLRFFLKSSSMLPIAEDLGMVPDWVRTILLELGIAGTKVLRWEGMCPVRDYPKVSMTTVSTHDTETFWHWFCQNQKEARAFLEAQGESGLDYKTLLYYAHKSNSLFHINLLQEYFPLVEEFLWKGGGDERVNDPSQPSSVLNWGYRFFPYVEQIVENAPFSREMRSLVAD
jgi:4-alpha-glucanotransferase